MKRMYRFISTHTLLFEKKELFLVKTMASANLFMNSILLFVIILELYLIKMKWNDPDTVSHMFDFLYGSIGLSSFQLKNIS